MLKHDLCEPASRRARPKPRDPEMRQYPYGPCGLFCGRCPDPECEGCLSDNVDQWVEQCKFRTCSRERNVDFCCFCDDYPCRELHDFMNDEWPHHWTMEPNLEYIKKHGVEKWQQAQQDEWSCKGCGAEINWYQKTCACGQALDAFEPPT